MPHRNVSAEATHVADLGALYNKANSPKPFPAVSSFLGRLFIRI